MRTATVLMVLALTYLPLSCASSDAATAPAAAPSGIYVGADDGALAELAQKYYFIVSDTVTRAGVPITPDGETAIRKIVRDAADRARRMSDEDQKNAAGFGEKLVKNARFSEHFGHKVVDADVVQTTFRLLCSPPFYPFC